MSVKRFSVRMYDPARDASIERVNSEALLLVGKSGAECCAQDVKLTSQTHPSRTMKASNALRRAAPSTFAACFFDSAIDRHARNAQGSCCGCRALTRRNQIENGAPVDARFSACVDTDIFWRLQCPWRGDLGAVRFRTAPRPPAFRRRRDLPMSRYRRCARERADGRQLPRSRGRCWRGLAATGRADQVALMNLSWRGEFDSLAHHIDHHFASKSTRNPAFE